jgi:integrase/recombinase XerD
MVENSILSFEHLLREEEKSEATIAKYLHDIRFFISFLGKQEISKQLVMQYKDYLAQHYKSASANSMLVSLNRFLRFIGREESCVRLLRIQRQIFASEDRELSKKEYQRLLKAAQHRQSYRIALIMQTICGTGIRISELSYITAEAVLTGKSVVNCKNKTRVIFIPVLLQNLLKKYMKKAGIQSGPVFLSRSGKALNRSNIWREMKALCESAQVAPEKVYPHNLRHLFARLFYSIEKDIVRLADLLGHSSINTTRIYTMETGYEHRSRLEKVQRLLWT